MDSRGPSRSALAFGFGLLPYTTEAGASWHSRSRGVKTNHHMDIICAGMYRSGSTWQYQVAAAIVSRHLHGTALGFIEGDAYNPGDGDDHTHRVLKTHQAHRRFSWALHARAARALYVMRDPRDVAFSAMRFWATTFEEVTGPGGVIEKCLANDTFWTNQPGVLVQRYRQNVIDPPAAVRQIARWLGLEPDWVAAARLADEFSFRRNKELSQLTPQPPVDSLLHPRHVEDGRIGGWRELATLRQRWTLAELCGDWLIDRGYELDLAWAEQAAGLTEGPLCASA